MSGSSYVVPLSSTDPFDVSGVEGELNGLTVSLGVFGGVYVKSTSCANLELDESIRRTLRNAFEERNNLNISSHSLQHTRRLCDRLRQRVVALKTAQAAFSILYSEYKKGVVYDGLNIELVNRYLSDKWAAIEEQFKEAIESITTLSKNVETVGRFQERVLQISQSLQELTVRLNTKKVVLATDGALLSAVTERLNELRVDSSRYADKALLKSEIIYLETFAGNTFERIQRVTRLYEWHLELMQVKKDLGYDALIHDILERETVDAIYEQLNRCAEGEGIIDCDYARPIMNNLRAIIEHFSPIVQSWQTFAKALSKLHKFDSFKVEVSKHVEELTRVFTTAEKTFVLFEYHTIRSSCGIPIPWGWGRDEDPLSVYSCYGHYARENGTPVHNYHELEGLSRPDRCIDIQYFGLISAANRYCRQVKQNNDLLLGLCMEAGKKVIDNALARLRRWAPEYQTRLANIHAVHANWAPDVPPDCVVVLGEERIPLHMAVLARNIVDFPKCFFAVALSATWKGNQVPVLNMPSNLSPLAVMEFISWLYGVRSIEEISPYISGEFIEDIYPYTVKKFHEACDYLLESGGVELANRVTGFPVNELNHLADIEVACGIQGSDTIVFHRCYLRHLVHTKVLTEANYATIMDLSGLSKPAAEHLKSVLYQAENTCDSKTLAELKAFCSYHGILIFP